VSRWQSSPRFRRRALWTLTVVAAAAGLAAVALEMENTPDFPKQRLVDRPAQVAAAPRIARLSPAETAVLLRTSTLFVRRAVAHTHMREAYDMVGPELRGGLSRVEWAKGDNPVVPFPAVGIEQWSVAYSYRNDVALDLALVAKPGSDTIGKTFRIELTRGRSDGPWRVVAWVPNGVSGPGNVRSIARRQSQVVAQSSTTLGAWWLLFPVSLLSLALVLPAAIWLRSWRTARKAEQIYRAARGAPLDL
jgi:hypothetical protein